MRKKINQNKSLRCEQPIKKSMTKIQYYVTQENATEPAFKNEYYSNHNPGIYVDIVSGEPLFSSTDKFDSNTGWPSFTKPIKEGAITHNEDYLIGYKRIEIRSSKANSHLGHLFKDGPLPTKNRYCINSASLRFIHKDSLESEDFGQYLELFDYP